MNNTVSVKTPGTTLTEAIRQGITAQLAEGGLRPGEHIDERELCERFSVSRTPVREAVMQLAVQGFLALEGRSGVTVPKLSIGTLRELLEFLGELEAVVARLAAKRATAAQRTTLTEALSACESATQLGDADAYQQANDRFHELVYTMARNDRMVEQIKVLRLRCAAYTRNRFEQTGRITRSLTEHSEIASAIVQGDEARAHAAMLEHISIGGREFAEFVSGLPAEMLVG